jgi:hypothetical protein
MCASQSTRWFKPRLIMTLLQRDFPGVEPRPKLTHSDPSQYLPPSRKRPRSPPSGSFEYSPRFSGLRSWSGNCIYSRGPPSSYTVRHTSPLYNPSPGKHRRTLTTGANALPIRSLEPDRLTVQVRIVRKYVKATPLSNRQTLLNRIRNPARSRGVSSLTSRRSLPRTSLRPLHRFSSAGLLI